MIDKLNVIRQWVQFAVVMFGFLVATYMYMTGKTNVPPPAPPVIPQVIYVGIPMTGVAMQPPVAIPNKE
jgi:hypothetical protein